MSHPQCDWLDVSHLSGSTSEFIGWMPLFETLLTDLGDLMAGTPATMQLLQVKEKLGELRFYYRLEHADDAIANSVKKLVHESMRLSATTCIRCGAPATVRNMNGWMAPMCDAHARTPEFRFSAELGRAGMPMLATSFPAYDWLDVTRVLDYVTHHAGWKTLVENLLAEIEDILTGSPTKLRLSQVKETFGELRFYYGLENADDATYDKLEEIVRKSMRASKVTCIRCGRPATIRNMNGWIAPMCEAHAKSSEFR